MSDVGMSDANTFTMGAFYHSTVALCPKHGKVGGDFRVFVSAEPEYTTPSICPKCYVDWVGANVQAVTRIPSTGAHP